MGREVHLINPFPGSRVSASGFRVGVLCFSPWELVSGFGFRVPDFGFRVSGVWLRISIFGFEFSVFGFRVRFLVFGFLVLDYGLRFLSFGVLSWGSCAWKNASSSSIESVRFSSLSYVACRGMRTCVLQV